MPIPGAVDTTATEKQCRENPSSSDLHPVHTVSLGRTAEKSKVKPPPRHVVLAGMSTLFRGGFPFLLVLASSLWADPDAIGTLDAYDGSVTVVRSGAPLPADQVDTGFVFENNDQVRVGSDGWADIALDNKRGIKASLHLKPSTSVLLDLSSLVPSQTASLDLLLGSIALKVQKLTGANGLQVHTETASMGVRGTVFGVDTEVDGSVLLTTTEGRVELAPEGGVSHFSVPGTAVRSEGEETSQWIEEPVGDSQTYVETWHRGRAQLFEQRRGVILAVLAQRYRMLSERFAQARQRLEDNRDLWQKWSQEERQGTRSTLLADRRLKARLLVNLQVTRRLAWSLERVHQRLVSIEARIGAEPFALLDVKLPAGSWSDFVKTWRENRPQLEAQLAETQYRVKLFAVRDGPLAR